MNNEDVLQRNAAGELEIRTAPSTGDTGTNPDDVYTRDEQGRLCVRTTGGGGGGGTTPTAAGVSFDPADLTTITADNVQSALEEVDAALSGKVATAQGAENAGKYLSVDEDGNVALVQNPIPSDGTVGQVLTKTESGQEWQDASSGSSLPDQTGNSGALLTTDGTEASWSEYSLKSGGVSQQIVLCPKGANIVGSTLGQIYLSGNKETDPDRAGINDSAGAIGIGYNINIKNSAGCVVFSSSYFYTGYPQNYTIENKPRQFIWINPNGIFPLFDQNGFLFKERLPQTNYGLKISDTFTQAVNTATTYNLFTTVDLASDVTLAANMDASNYSLVDGALKLPTNAGYIDYGIEVRLNGSFAGGENTNREFGIQLQRADGTIISEKAIVKVSGNDLSNRSVVFETYTNTDTDPFIANGLKLVINNTSGQTLNLTGCDILIKARA